LSISAPTYPGGCAGVQRIDGVDAAATATVLLDVSVVRLRCVDLA